jgi:hypothetical protein
MGRKLAVLWPIAIAIVPVVVAAARAAAGGWTPVGDDAYFTARSMDVLTRHHPLVGAWSSGSAGSDDWTVNNLGPLQLDLLAPFTRWTPIAGTAIGVAVVHIAAIAAIGWLVGRLGGRRLVLPAMVPVAILTWTMGSEMLITPRQHQYSVVPYLCLLVAAWAVTSGDRWGLVVAVVAGSLLAQTHLTYPVLVAAVALVMLVGQVLSTRAGQARGGRLPIVVAGVVAIVLWVQPLIDQVSGFQNLGNVVGGGGDGEPTGFGRGLRIVVGGLLPPDVLLRPGYRRYDWAIPDADPWQLGVFGLLLVTVVVATCRARRRIDGTTVAGVAVGVVAVLAGVLNASLIPSTTFGLNVGNYRWLWSTAAFVVLVGLLLTWRRWLLDRDGGDRTRWAVPAAVVVLVAATAANVPRSIQTEQRGHYLDEQRSVEQMTAQVHEAARRGEIDGPVLVDDTTVAFGTGFTFPLLVQLQEQDIEFRFEAPGQERRFGTSRRADGTEQSRLRILTGDVEVGPDDPGVIAHVGGAAPVVVVLEPT